MLAGGVPDRIPNGLGATINTGMHLLAYEKLKSLLGVDAGPTRIMSFEMNALFDLEAIEALEGDMIILGLKINPARFYLPGSESDWKPVRLWDREFLLPVQWDVQRDPDGTTWIDGFRWDAVDWNVPLDRPGCRLKCPPGGFYFDPVPLPGQVPLSDPTPDQYHPPYGYSDEWLRQLEESARWLFQNTEYSIVCGEMINDFQLAPGGLDSWWMRLVMEPQAVHEFLAKACEAAVSQLRLLDQAVGSYADMLMIAQDFGDLRGVQIGPELWREIYKPHFRRLFEEWHRITDMKASMHSCGSIVDILPDLAECGLEVINPVQVSARGMEPERLKQMVGDRLIFYGGSYDAVAVPVDTPAEAVYEQVRKNIQALSRDGGYLFAGVHNLQGNLPPEHLEALLRAYRDCRSYVSGSSSHGSSSRV